MIYLDYSANTPADPAVLDAFLRSERRYIGNPNSTQPDEVIYTSGASEANNLAIKGIVQASHRAGGHIISTPLEHSSVAGALAALEKQGCTVELVDIKSDGTVDLDCLRNLLRDDTVLVAVCAVDSELGTVQPIREIAEILSERPNCRLHVDATQAVGKTELAVSGVDTMSIAPHKFYGPNGSGILIKSVALPLSRRYTAAAAPRPTAAARRHSAWLWRPRWRCA